MLVYGDAVRRLAPASMIGGIATSLDESASMTGIVRHAALVAALMEAGELAQGLADAAFDARGLLDARSPETDLAMDVAVALARCVLASWESGFETATPPPRAELARLSALTLPSEVKARQPEGFAHYGVYPETYGVAAGALAGRPVRVIGIRSIGTTLAAIVAAAAGAPSPITLRPVGHPFRRELALDADLARSLAAEPDVGHAVVDEGPGLSGSSMACVADSLLASGVAVQRIHLFPSHRNGPGPHATDEVRATWGRLRSHVTTFDELVLSASDPRHRLESWVRDLVGDPEGPLRDISGGAWRRLRYADPAEWPPVHAWGERRKFLLRTASGTWLLRFAGLGRIGQAKFERGRRLGEASLVPEVVGLRHGFLVERWREDSRGIDLSGPGRPAILARLAHYLAFRAREFPSAPGRGASLAELARMAAHNAAEALGPEMGRRVADALSCSAKLERFSHPVETDNRLHVWEWLATVDGILKADALDHHAGHDLVGDQDIGWDIAGAATEFALSEGETATLVAEVERGSGRPISPDLVRIYSVCYRTFQLGYHNMAAASADGESERRRLHSAELFYANGLRAEFA